MPSIERLRFYVSRRLNIKFELITPRLLMKLVRSHDLEPEIKAVFDRRTVQTYLNLQQKCVPGLTAAERGRCAKAILSVFDKTEAFKIAQNAMRRDVPVRVFSRYWGQIWRLAERSRDVNYQGTTIVSGDEDVADVLDG
ncbi:hypothetical protein SS50377_26350 [Spironucleus salmonicida]|uniref:Uncharacterized protein n=1 Tax=Spironucleus salmonicida TaxID=348837 RepID=A0A9P8LQ15_9EUKA|nr:hypothetical protein SS50377_26350 [Spironucleus salmonicida]